MAEAKCTSSISRMEFLSSTLPTAISCAKEEILSGVLRNSRGTKVYVSLLDTVLVVGRCVSRPSIGKVIQVSRVCSTKSGWERGGIDFLSLWRGVIIIFGLQFQNSTWGEEEYFIKLLCIPWPFPINCLGTRIIVLIDWLIDWLTCVGLPWPYPNQLPGVHGSKWWRSC